MREILFRGKRLDNGEYEEGFYCKHDKVKCCFSEDDPETKHLIIKDGFCDWGFEPPLQCVEVDPATVGQFTGLLDKHGNRIFEGDICRNTKTNEIASVHWHGSMAGFVWNQKRDGSEYLYDFGALFRVHDKYEIIGNIHDNTELLEED